MSAGFGKGKNRRWKFSVSKCVRSEGAVGSAGPEGKGACQESTATAYNFLGVGGTFLGQVILSSRLLVFSGDHFAGRVGWVFFP